MNKKTYWVNIYSTGRAYGGPEEGGWWYNYGTPNGESIKCVTIDEAVQVRRTLLNKYNEYNNDHEPIQNVHGDGVINVCIETHKPRKYPKAKPFYS